MCVTRNWKRIEANSVSEIITARRSDNVIIWFFTTEFPSINDFVIKLEEFRNCKCLPNVPCSKHIEESERINANS